MATAAKVDRTMAKSEGRSAEGKSGRTEDSTGTPHAAQTSAPRKSNGRRILTDHRSPAPEAQTGPIIAGSSDRRTGQAARSDTRERMRIRRTMAYSPRLMAITESCSATLTAAVERSSM